MNESLFYIKYKLNDFYRNVYQKVLKHKPLIKKYAEHNYLNIEDGNNYIRDSIDSGKPCMIARYGGFEIQTMFQAEKNLKESTIFHLCNNAGFFPNDKSAVICFSKLMKECSENVDGLGSFLWNDEEWAVYSCCKNIKAVFTARALEPWYAKIPWTSSLKGKKVLVIHPFIETISKQYKFREQLFENKNLLPEFELKTLKSVVTLSGEIDDRFKNWFEALNWMHKQTLYIDYDIALLGCGAYGFPLAALIKKDGKQAIQMGGALQILFGIKGVRWDNHPVISKLYNQNWVRPSDAETPKNAKNVENNCYW